MAQRINMLRLIAKPELKKIRESVCTQEEMMQLLEVQLGRPFPRTTYTHKENSSYSCSSDEAIAIAKILRVNINEIFEQAPDKKVSAKDEGEEEQDDHRDGEEE